LIISKENYTTRKEQYQIQIDAILNYATSSSKCRSQLLLKHFDEKNTTRCGECDVCISLNSIGISNLEFERIRKDIKAELKKKPLMQHELFFKLTGNEENIQTVMRWLLDNGMLSIRVDEKLEWLN
jgi:ATP-dependent DNA helicase RecQ